MSLVDAGQRVIQVFYKNDSNSFEFEFEFYKNEHFIKYQS